MLAYACYDGVRLWDLDGGRVVAHLPVGQTRSVAFHPAGTALITSGFSGLRRWPIAPAGPDCDLRIGPPEILGGPVHFHAPEADLSRDGRSLAAFADGGRLAVYDLSQPAERMILDGHRAAAGLAISPDGQRVVVTFETQSGAQIWETRSGRQAKVSLPDTYEGCRIFSPEGKWLVTSTVYDYRFWRVGSWKLGLRIPREPRRFVHLAFSPCGKILAIAKTPYVV